MSLFKNLFDSYDQFHASEIITNRFSLELFQETLSTYSLNYSVEVIGESIEGREIKVIKIGNGNTKVLMWTQMHGDESTATRAILDILKFLNSPGDLKDVQQSISNSLTLYIIPILNPDGAVRFQRRNALDIDLNRDARAFASPEARILRDMIQDFQPDYGFNLHDQNRSYNISGLHTPSTISFLAPSFNLEEDINEIRAEAMKLIAMIRKGLEKVIPRQVGLYKSDYSPRGFGDYAQGQGVSTILVESGWFHNDPEKEFVRKLNFCLLTYALDAITDKKHEKYGISDYNVIPFMDETFFDFLIRNVKVSKDGSDYSIDIGIRHEEVNNGNVCDYFTMGKVSEIGDLSTCLGFTVLEEKELYLQPGKVWSEPVGSLEEFGQEKVLDLVRQGYLFIKSKDATDGGNTNQPINLVSKDYLPEKLPQINGLANFLLTSKAGEVKYVVVNGYLWKVDDPISENFVGLIF